MLRKQMQLSAMVALMVAMANVSYAQQNKPENAPLQVSLSYKGQRAIEIAQELISQGNYDFALKQAEVAIKADPKSGMPYMVKAYILDQKNESKQAEKIYAKALLLSPNNGYILNAYAAHLCQKKQYARADSSFLKASTDINYPLVKDTFENAAQCNLENNNLVLAEERARAALNINPEAARALEIMAQVKFKQSLFFEARAFMQRRESLGMLDIQLLQLATLIEKSAGDERAAAQYQEQLHTLLQAQIQPPTGEGQKKP